MEIKRDRYLKRLIAHKGNGRVKIVTGIRRCGKSYLLFQLFKRHLIETGVCTVGILNTYNRKTAAGGASAGECR